MSILSRSCSLSQYTTSTDLPNDFLSEVVNKVRKNAFLEIEEDSIKERSIGWVDLYNMLDNEFETVNFLKEPFIALSMRVDKKNVPASVIKRNALMMERQIKEDEEIEFIPVKRRKDIKEAVRRKLLLNAIPVTQTYDMVWNYTTGHILFTHTNEKICDEFQELFYETFGVRTNLIELSIVGSVILEANKIKTTEDFKYCEMPGSDFLMWLWYKYRDDTNEFDYESNKVRLFFDDKVVLSDEYSEDTQVVTCIGDSYNMNEIQTALDEGKKIIQAKLILTTPVGDWYFFLDAFYFDFKAIKTPKVRIGKNDDMDEVFYEKISLIQDAIDILNKIYGEFVIEYSQKGEVEQ